MYTITPQSASYLSSQDTAECALALAADVVGEAVFGQLDEREKRLINFVAEHKKITAADGARLLTIDWKTARNILDRLAARQLLERVCRFSRDPKTHYRLAIAGPTQS